MNSTEIIALVSTCIAVFALLNTYCFNRKTFQQNKKLETIKLVNEIRTEIWSIVGYANVSSVNDDQKKRAIKQRLEYLATAANNDILDKKIIKRLCRKWFCGVVEDLGVVDKPEKQKSSFTPWNEIKDLYREFDCKNR
ncbi:MAG: hypothetical protein PHU97_04435 [Bacteroidales bacterium]|nr:hypothetical protein [Bacteroidales bacterium]MDY0286431.1 hypothetical protein [Bacteroidales bacterium]HPE87046.1 hypothetical protein [Bacteroidales bacterium]